MPGPSKTNAVTEEQAAYDNTLAVLFMFGAQDARSMQERGVEIPQRGHLLSGYPSVFKDRYDAGYRLGVSEREERTG